MDSINENDNHTRHGENSVVPLRNGKVCSVHMLKSKDHEYYALNHKNKAALYGRIFR